VGPGPPWDPRWLWQRRFRLSWRRACAPLLRRWSAEIFSPRIASSNTSSGSSREMCTLLPGRPEWHPFADGVSRTLLARSPFGARASAAKGIKYSALAEGSSAASTRPIATDDPETNLSAKRRLLTVLSSLRTEAAHLFWACSKKLCRPKIVDQKLLTICRQE